MGQKQIGFVPNLYAIMAESPAALAAYTGISAALDQHAALSAVERNLAAIAVSRENNCEYCVAAHSVIASMVKAPEGQVEAVRAGEPLDDPKLEALRRFAVTVSEKRGLPSEEDLQAFFEAGYERRHVLDVVTLFALKTLSNYTNHITGTPLDAAFAPKAWKRAA